MIERDLDFMRGVCYGGGGGTSGAVDFPQHMKDAHIDWLGDTSLLTVDLTDVMDTALGVGGNPWESASMTDPETDLAEIETRFAELDTALDSLGIETDWTTLVDAVVTKVDTAGVLTDVDVASIIEDARAGTTLELREAVQAAIEVLDDVTIRSAVRAFERRSDTARIRSVNRFAGTMSDINAVQSSAFMLGMALIESQHLQSVDEFDAQLTTELYRGAVAAHIDAYKTDFSLRLQERMEAKRTRDIILRDASSYLYQSLFSKVDMNRAVTTTLSEIKRLRFVATQEFETTDFDLDYKAAAWDFEVFANASNVLASISGAAAVLPEKKSRAASALGGAVGGAAAGAGLGPVGIAGGALLGGLGGLFG